VQCTKGHISCSGCCTGGAQNYECLMCREEETATRCRAMEHVLAGLSVPCAFRVLGCAEMVPYAERQAHEATCYYLTRPCPIADCNGYRSGGSLRDHVVADHREVLRVDVGPGRLTAMRMRAGEHARVLCLGGGSDKEFMLVVGRDIPSGRALSVIRLFDEPLDADEKFRYRIEVASGASVFSLSGQPGGADHLIKPYQADAFLFVPNAVWDADPEDVPVFVELN
jgi:E3 ubiquitin-protein ligase SIAH1